MGHGGRQCGRSDGGQGLVGSVKATLSLALDHAYQPACQEIHIPVVPLDRIGFQVCMTPPIRPLVNLINTIVTETHVEGE